MKKNLVDDYMTIAKRYIPSILLKQSETSGNHYICNVCGQSCIIKTIYEYICSNCGNILMTIHQHESSYDDTQRVNIVSKYSYDRRDHFRDCIIQYQGKQHTQLPPSLITDMKKYFVFNNMCNDVYTNKSSYYYSDIKKSNILSYLKEVGMTKYYDDINMIYHIITNKPLPDISELEDQLINEFDIFIQEYDKMFRYKKSDNQPYRKSFIYINVISVSDL